MIRGADIRRVAREVLVDTVGAELFSERAPSRAHLLTWQLLDAWKGAPEARLRGCIPVSERTEFAAWLSLGVRVGGRLGGGDDSLPEAADEQIRRALEDDDAMVAEHDDMGALRAVDVEPVEAIAAASDIVIDGEASDPTEARSAFLRGLRIGLRASTSEEH